MVINNLMMDHDGNLHIEELLNKLGNFILTWKLLFADVLINGMIYDKRTVNTYKTTTKYYDSNGFTILTHYPVG